MNNGTVSESKATVGLDVGDCFTQVCVFDEAGEVIEGDRLENRNQALGNNVLVGAQKRG